MPAIKSEASGAPDAPTMVAVGSPEFQEAVAVAVALALAGMPVPLPVEALAPATAGQQPVVIQATSLDTTQPGLDDLTVRFTRFCTFQNCGYQRGQEAGFPRKAAEDLQAAGSAFIVHDPRRERRAA